MAWMWHPRHTAWYGRCRSDARPVWRLRGGLPRQHAERYRVLGGPAAHRPDGRPPPPSVNPRKHRSLAHEHATADHLSASSVAARRPTATRRRGCPPHDPDWRPSPGGGYSGRKAGRGVGTIGRAVSRAGKAPRTRRAVIRRRTARRVPVRGTQDTPRKRKEAWARSGAWPPRAQTEKAR